MPTLVSEPTHFPGKTFVDGMVRGPAVLLQMIEPGGPGLHGAVYLSRSMVRDCARLMRDVVEELAGELRWVAADQHATTVAELEGKVLELETRIAELEPMERLLAKTAARYGGLEADDEPIRHTVKSDSYSQTTGTRQPRKR